ncbi:Polyubiquitin protein [Spatholobus suberectus]|nr:Polyubiquitin protein [Spatholobus suberectus]
MVNFKIAGGEIVPEIEMTLSDTVFDLKQKIQKELDVEVYRQSLWHHNRMLRDHEYIEDYDFRVSETLYLTVTPLPPHHKLHVLVKSVGSDGYVRVKETDKVSDLRSKVERYWGIPSNLITLKRRNVVMENNLPLYAYYVNEASEVQLSVLIEPR